MKLGHSILFAMIAGPATAAALDAGLLTSAARNLVDTQGEARTVGLSSGSGNNPETKPLSLPSGLTLNVSRKSSLRGRASFSSSAITLSKKNDPKVNTLTGNPKPELSVHGSQDGQLEIAATTTNDKKHVNGGPRALQATTPPEESAGETPAPSNPETETPTTDAPDGCLEFELTLTTPPTGMNDSVLLVFEEGKVEDAVIAQDVFEASNTYSASEEELCLDSDKCWEILFADGNGDVEGASLSLTVGETTDIFSEPGTLCEVCDPPITFWSASMGNCCMSIHYEFTVGDSANYTTFIFNAQDLVDGNGVDTIMYGDLFDIGVTYTITDADMDFCFNKNECYGLYIEKEDSDGFTGVGGATLKINDEVVFSASAESNNYSLQEDGNSFFLALFGNCV